MPINYSIIIPHKNIPDLLIRCIRSIPRRDDIQIIVVDDNSDNANTYLSIYPELRQSNIELYLTKEGRGAGYARNVGLGKAKGKWILFADSDDFFLPEWINITDQYLNSNADVIQFKIDDVLNHDDCNWHNKALDNYTKGMKSAKDVLFSNVTCWAKMLNANFIRHNRIMFDETICANDVGFGFKIAVMAANVTISQSAIYDVTYREGSLTTIKNREYKAVRYSVLKNAYTYAAEKGFSQYELPYVIEALKSWRELGIPDYLFFILHEHSEIRRASKVHIVNKPFNYRHPYIYIFLVLLKMI